MTFAIGDKVKINAPGVYGDNHEGVVTATADGINHPYRVKFETVNGFEDDCNYKGGELTLIESSDTLSSASVEQLEAELEKRNKEGSFPARIRALPVGTIFLSPFTAEPMVRTAEDEVVYELSKTSPTRVGINSVSNMIVDPLVVIYQP